MRFAGGRGEAAVGKRSPVALVVQPDRALCHHALERDPLEPQAPRTREGESVSSMIDLRPKQIIEFGGELFAVGKSEPNGFQQG